MSYWTMVTGPGMGLFNEDDCYPGKIGRTISAVGALSSMSKNLGDGGWCEGCRNLGLYTWLSEGWKRREGPWSCRRCHTRNPNITNKD